MAHKLLLADDSITIQKVVSLTFAEEDFDVTCVGNGEIALEKIREARPDIILADIFMPRKTGYEVCEFVKSSPLYQHIPVILLVGTFEPFDKNEAARVRSDGYLTKPFETTALVKLVRQTLAKAGPAPAAPAPPARAAEADKTLQVPLEDLKRRLEQTARPVSVPPVHGPDEILELPPLRRPAEEFDQTLIAPAAAPAGSLGPDEVLLAPEEELVVPAAPPEPLSLHSAPTVTMPAAAEPPPAPVPEPALAAAPAEAPPAEEDLLEVPVIVRRVRVPSDEDILGVFELINLDAIIARQQRLEEAVRLEQERRQAPVITAPEPEREAPAEYPPEAAAEKEEALFEEVAAPPRAAAAAAPAPVHEVSVEAALDSDTVTRIARLVVEKLSEKVIRDIAWEVVPDLAEMIIRQEIEKRKADGKL
jgi:CheY-like chemotaxis protein